MIYANIDICSRCLTRVIRSVAASFDKSEAARLANSGVKFPLYPVDTVREFAKDFHVGTLHSTESNCPECGTPIKKGECPECEKIVDLAERRKKRAIRILRENLKRSGLLK